MEVLLFPERKKSPKKRADSEASIKLSILTRLHLFLRSAESVRVARPIYCQLCPPARGPFLATKLTDSCMHVTIVMKHVDKIKQNKCARVLYHRVHSFAVMRKQNLFFQWQILSKALLRGVKIKARVSCENVVSTCTADSPGQAKGLFCIVVSVYLNWSHKQLQQVRLRYT